MKFSDGARESPGTAPSGIHGPDENLCLVLKWWGGRKAFILVLAIEYCRMNYIRQGTVFDGVVVGYHLSALIH